MSNEIHERVYTTKTLDELCDVLNDLNDEDLENSGVTASEYPTFNNKSPDPDGTTEVWSWDDTRVMLVHNKYYLEKRCTVCGEAQFNCSHEDEDEIRDYRASE